MANPWFLWNTLLSHTARLSTALQILIYLPITLAAISKTAFLFLSFLVAGHALIHGALIFFWGSPALSVLQVPMHPFLLLVVFNLFSSSPNSIWIITASWWGYALTLSGPLFIGLEGLSSLLVAQKLGQKGKELVESERGEVAQFLLLVLSACTYVCSAWWIVASYPSAATSPLSSTLLGVALTALVFLTFIGFVLRRTNVIESSCLALCIAYNVWLCGFDAGSMSQGGSTYVPLVANILPHFQALLNFVTNTLPKPVLVGLVYRLAILHLASRILPTIGADSWESEDGVDDGWDGRPTSSLSFVLITFRQFIFTAVYSHLLMLDHTSQVWWRWINIFFTLFMWAVELLVSSEDDGATKDWKID